MRFCFWTPSLNSSNSSYSSRSTNSTHQTIARQPLGHHSTERPKVNQNSFTLRGMNMICELLVTCHLSLVTCHLSHVTCHMSLVTCHLKFRLVDTLFKCGLSFFHFQSGNASKSQNKCILAIFEDFLIEKEKNHFYQHGDQLTEFHFLLSPHGNQLTENKLNSFSI